MIAYGVGMTMIEGLDQLYGEAGDDTLIGGDDQDVLDGGDGADSLRIRS